MLARRECLHAVCAPALMGRTSSSYRSEIEKWRKDRDQNMVGPDGPFTLVARLFPKTGLSSFGGDKSCDLVIPVARAPARVGESELRGLKATVHVLPDIQATVDKKAVKVFEVTPELPIQLAVNGIGLSMKFRMATLGIGVIDPDSPMRAQAAPVRWFPTRGIE